MSWPPTGPTTMDTGKCVRHEGCPGPPLGPLRWTLANADGSLRKTNKAAIAREFEKNVSPAETIPTPPTCIIDGMGLVQMTNGNNKTFAQLAESVLSLVLYVSGQSVVFDVYRQPSIKYSERLKQLRLVFQNIWWCEHSPSVHIPGKGTQHTAVETIPVQLYQQDEPHQFVGWRVETTAMQRYAARHCMQPAKKPASIWQQMNGWKWWSCSAPRKKAGTHLFLHALHAARTGSKAVTAEDTDVMLLCLAFQKDIPCPIN